MKNSKRPTPPKTLSAEAKTWWKRLVDEYELEDQAGLLILQQACEALDRLRDAQKAIEKEGVTVKDRFNQIRQNPATMIERDSRTALLRALKALNLDIEAPGSVGRPQKGY